MAIVGMGGGHLQLYEPLGTRCANGTLKSLAYTRPHSNEGLPGVLGNKGTLAKYQREQGNISQFLGTGEQTSKNYSTKTF